MYVVHIDHIHINWTRFNEHCLNGSNYESVTKFWQNVDIELANFKGYSNGRVLVFDNEEMFNWFILKWA